MRKWRALWLLASSAARVDPRRAVAFVSLVVVARMSAVGIAWSLKLFVDAVLAGSATMALRAALVAGGAVALRQVADYPVVTIGDTLIQRASMEIERRLMSMVLSLPGIEHHERPEYLDELELIRTNRWHFSESLGSVVDTSATVVLAVVSTVLLARVDLLLALLPLAAVPSIAATVAKQRLYTRFENTVAERNRLAARIRTVGNTLDAGMELRLFGLGDGLVRRFNALKREVEDERLRTDVRAAAVQGAGDFFLGAGKAAAIALLVWRAVTGHVTLGEVILGVSLVGQVETQIESAMNGVRWMLETLVTVGRFLRLVDEIDGAGACPAHAQVPARLVDGITFHDVSFRYPGTDEDVLAGVDLHLPAGSTVAIVGDNGAGKTTIVKLLARFYEPSSGRITVDGVPLAGIEPVVWRTRMSAAFQDFAKFQFVARESVGVGDVARVDDEDAVLAALERAAAGDIPSRLPAGLDTQLGTFFPHGVDLSGGEWQKVALGRAMMPQHPLLLVLDEPTAALDATTEAALFDRYARASREAAASTGAITLFVSHRFSTVRMAGLIVVVSAGRVAELGTHDELIALGGIYAELYGLQARAYR